MPQRYAKDNRTTHLTARSDKSVAYVTNNKRLYSTFCTVEGTKHHAASFDSRTTCTFLLSVQPQNLAAFVGGCKFICLRLFVSKITQKHVDGFG